MALEPADIRTIALVGHTGSGKTMLAEAILQAGGAIRDLGSVDAGTTVADFAPEEREARASINTSVMHAEWKKRHIQVLDTPGYMDFAGQAISALYAADLAAITVNAASGIEVTTRKMWECALETGLPRMVVITRLDSDNAKFDEVLEGLRSAFGAAVAAVSIPKGTGREIEGVIDLLNTEGELPPEADGMRQSLLESAISADDDLLEKYLEGEEIAPEAMAKVVHRAIVSGNLVPVFSVAAEKGFGVDCLLDFVTTYGPTPLDARPAVAASSGRPEGPTDRAAAEGEEGGDEGGDEGGEEVNRLTPQPDGPFVARVFKVMSDDYVGKVSFMRVYQGAIKAGATIHVSGGESAKLAKLFRYQGKEQKEVASAVAGEVVATSKIDALTFGETCLDGPEGVRLAMPSVPTPMVERAIEPKTRGDEGKISEALRKLADEDPTFRWRQDPQTKETVVAGMGDRHLKIMFDRMKRRFQLEVSTRTPKIAYRETITATATARYRHKKQTGGAGQFAECEVRVEPNERGAGYEFLDEIFGGSIDLPFRQSVDKGVRQQIADGILAGFPVVDIKVALVDGKTHPVDSKDIAFQIAGRNVVKEAVMKAKPVLIEPVVNMEIAVPTRFMGDITGDISGRRGRIQGMETLGDMQVVKAQVPAAEVQTYSTELQSLTGGEAFYTMEFSHYDAVPSNVAQQVIAQRKREKES